MPNQALNFSLGEDFGLSEQHNPENVLFDHPQSNKALSCVHMKLHVFQFVPVASCPVSGHYGGESGSLFLISSHQVNIVKISPTLLHAEELQLLQPQLV